MLDGLGADQVAVVGRDGCTLPTPIALTLTKIVRDDEAGSYLSILPYSHGEIPLVQCIRTPVGVRVS